MSLVVLPKQTPSAAARVFQQSFSLLREVLLHIPWKGYLLSEVPGEWVENVEVVMVGTAVAHLASYPERFASQSSSLQISERLEVWGPVSWAFWSQVE